MFPWRPKKSVNLPDICSSSGRTPPNSKLHELLIFWGYFTWSKRAAWKSYAWGLSRKPRPMKACLLLPPAPMVALLLVKKLSSMCIIPSFFAPLMVHLYVQEDDKEIWCREQKTALCPLTGSVLNPQYKEPVYTNSSIMTHKWSWEIILHKTCHHIIFANCTKILPTASDISINNLLLSMTASTGRGWSSLKNAWANNSPAIQPANENHQVEHWTCLNWMHFQIRFLPPCSSLHFWRETSWFKLMGCSKILYIGGWHGTSLGLDPLGCRAGNHIVWYWQDMDTQNHAPQPFEAHDSPYMTANSNRGWQKLVQYWLCQLHMGQNTGSTIVVEARGW